MKFHYQCSECSREYEIKPGVMVCTDCAEKQKLDEPLHGILEVVIDGEIERDFSVFDLLPVERRYFPEIPVGNTPLWQPKNLRKESGFPNLYIKDDTRNLTGSLKDRASFLVAAFASKHRIKEIAVASTGNAASSMSGVGAATNLSITIFIPKSAPKAKMVQSLQYGANVILVDGTYDQAFDLSMKYSKQSAILSRNTAYNPLTIEGKKTVALEIFQNLRKSPDYVFVPTGDGVILGGVYKGFYDLMKFGLIEKIPEIIAVQAKNSAAIYNAMSTGKFQPLENCETIADSISVGIPRNGYYALKQLRKYGGKCITVSDDDILSAQQELSSKSGLFTEPAAAASYAGFHSMQDKLPKDANIVVLVTGNGLKDINAAMKKIDIPSKSIKSLSQL